MRQTEKLGGHGWLGDHVQNVDLAAGFVFLGAGRLLVVKVLVAALDHELVRVVRRALLLRRAALRHRGSEVLLLRWVLREQRVQRGFFLLVVGHELVHVLDQGDLVLA